MNQTFSCFNCGGQGGRYEEDGFDTCYTCCGTGKVGQEAHEANNVSMLTEHFVSGIYNDIEAAKYNAETEEERWQREEYEAEFHAEYSHDEQLHLRQERYLRDTKEIRDLMLDLVKTLSPQQVAEGIEAFAKESQEASAKWQEDMRKKYATPKMNTTNTIVVDPVVMGLAKQSCEDEIPF